MADLSDIPDEAVEAGARAAYVKSSEWDKLDSTTQAIELRRARLTLAAALPYLTAAKDSELAELRAENAALKAKLNEAYQHIGEQALIDMEEPIPPYGSPERDAAVKALRGEQGE